MLSLIFFSCEISENLKKKIIIVFTIKRTKQI